MEFCNCGGFTAHNTQSKGNLNSKMRDVNMSKLSDMSNIETDEFIVSFL